MTWIDPQGVELGSRFRPRPGSALRVGRPDPPIVQQYASYRPRRMGGPFGWVEIEGAPWTVVTVRIDWTGSVRDPSTGGLSVGSSRTLRIA